MNLPARNTDPYTSHLAAAGAVKARPILRNLIVQALQLGPMTHDELIEEINQIKPASPSGVRTRVSELVTDGIVEPVPGETSKSALGREALLWRLVK